MQCDRLMLMVGFLFLTLSRFFFFSSRRRHTRSYGDWSSDVCSSDLGLSDDQKERVTRVAEVYNPQINNLKKKIDAMKGLPALGSQVIAMSVTLRKLTNDRENQLNKILTEEQREKHRDLSGSGNPSATPSPKQSTGGVTDVLNVTGTLTDKDPFDRVRRQCRCKVYEVEMRSDREYTIDLRSKEMDSYLRIE